jgi:hypothetical protein
MDSLLELFCVVCLSMGPPPHPQMSRAVGDIRYTHERLSRGAHLLRLSTTDFIIAADEGRERRLHAFASDYAARTCAGPFNLGEAARPSWPRARPVYAKQYLFRCAPIAAVKKHAS